MAAFTLGNDLFAKRDYAGAERLLLNARSWDPKTWSSRRRSVSYSRRSA